MAASDFNPRSRVGNDDAGIQGAGKARDISIHVPRVGNDFPDEFYLDPDNPQISIHVPRVGNDALRLYGQPEGLYFNPRSPRGERRIFFDFFNRFHPISIHVPRVGNDVTGFPSISSPSSHFNPRSPRGGTTSILVRPILHHANFNPRSPRGERL